MFNCKVAETYRPAYGPVQKNEVHCTSNSARGAKWFFTPVLAPMLQNRRLVRILAGLAVIQIIVVAAGLGAWKCPIHSALGVTSPGCGMTSAIILLLKGNCEAAVRMHAFAPLVMVVIILMTSAGILPPKYRYRITEAMATLESRSGISAIVLMAMVAYWLLRAF